jgi:hypothetical protein
LRAASLAAIGRAAARLTLANLPNRALEQDISSKRTPHEYSDMRRCRCEVRANWPGASSLPNLTCRPLPHFAGAAGRRNLSSKSLSSWSKFLAFGGFILTPASPYSSHGTMEIIDDAATTDDKGRVASDAGRGCPQYTIERGPQAERLEGRGRPGLVGVRRSTVLDCLPTSQKRTSVRGSDVDPTVLP